MACFQLIFTFLLAVTLNIGVGASDYGIVIGIDLGTTYSCVGVYRLGHVDIITNEQGNRITPSWVAFGGHERLVGDTAKQAFHTMPSQTIFDVKRLIGRKYSDPELQDDLARWPFLVVENEGRLAVRVNYQGEPRDFTPQEISAMILLKLKDTAELYLGTRVTHAIVTVPAYFNDAQRQATKDAGAIAGLTILRILSEPTAAAIAYGMDRKSEEIGREIKIIVYDLGGGTFDVSLLKVNQGVFEVLAVSGDTHLGGEDFDHRVMDYLIARYERQTSINVSQNKRAMSKLRREVERAKLTLSSQLTARLEIESFEGGNDFSFTLTRAKFAELNLDLFVRTLEPVRRVLQDAGVLASEIDDVVLVGGSTRIPKVRELLKELFGGKSPKMGINPDEAVAYGAAIQGGMFSGDRSVEDVILVDVNPLTLGIETSGGVFSPLIARNSPLPIRKSEVFSTVTNNQRAVLIKVFQGEQPLTKDNVLLGTFELSGIRPAARGVPQIEVLFEVDNDGIMKVSAHAKESGISQSIIITRDKQGLSEQEVARMTQEAVKFSLQDDMRDKRDSALNELERSILELKSELTTRSSPNSDSLYARLQAHSHWAEANGRLATTNELEERLSDVKGVLRLARDEAHTQSNLIETSMDVQKGLAQSISSEFESTSILVPELPLNTSLNPPDEKLEQSESGNATSVHQAPAEMIREEL